MTSTPPRQAKLTKAQRAALELTDNQREVLSTLAKHSTYDFAFANDGMRGWKSVANSLVKRGLVTRGGDVNDLLFITPAGRAALDPSTAGDVTDTTAGSGVDLVERLYWQRRGQPVPTTTAPESDSDVATFDKHGRRDAWFVMQTRITKRQKNLDAMFPITVPVDPMPVIAEPGDTEWPICQMCGDKLTYGNPDGWCCEYCRTINLIVPKSSARAEPTTQPLAVGDRCVVLAGATEWNNHEGSAYNYAFVREGQHVVIMQTHNDTAIIVPLPDGWECEMPLRYLARLDSRADGGAK